MEPLNRTTQVIVTFTTHSPSEHCPHGSGGKRVGSIHNMCKEDGFDAFWIISGRMFSLETKNKMLDDIHWSQSTKDSSQLQIQSPRSAIKEKSQVSHLWVIGTEYPWLPGIEKWAILASPNSENTSSLPSREKSHYCHLERREEPSLSSREKSHHHHLESRAIIAI